MKKNGSPPIPAYYRLQTTILEDIEKGRWKPGEGIPTERSLAELHRVSIGTVKKALLNLVHEGYLYRIQGKGTYVAGTTLRKESLRYYRLLKSFGDNEAELEVKVLNFEIVNGFRPANTFLGITLNQKLYELKRVFSKDGKPVVYNVSYLPIKMFKGLTDLPESLFEKVTLYRVLEKNYGFPTIYNHELFDAVAAEKEVAGVLGIRKGSPVLYMEMLSFTYKDKPYEYRKSYFSCDKRKVFRET